MMLIKEKYSEADVWSAKLGLERCFKLQRAYSIIFNLSNVGELFSS